MVEDTKRRRRELAMRFFTYGVMTIAVIVGVVFCVAWAMGYRFDLRSGQLSQVALLQFNTYPTGATVSVGKTTLTSRTPTRANVRTGSLNVTMRRDGYRTWAKQVTTQPSTVQWLDYVRLIPEKISTKSVKSFNNISDIKASPSRKWLAIVTDQNSHTLTLLDISNPEKVKDSEIKYSDDVVSAVPEGVSEQFSITEWDSGSRYVLVRHDYGDSTEYLKVDRQNKDKIQNLTRDFAMNIVDPHFSGNSGDVFYALTDGSIRKLDYGNKSVSSPLATDVTEYRLYGTSRLVYVTKTGEGDQLKQSVAIYNDGKVQQLRQFKDDKPVHVAFTEYNNEDYLAWSHDGKVTMLSNPLDESGLFSGGDEHADGSKSDTVTLNMDADWVQFNNSGRLLLAGKDKDVLVYDPETESQYNLTLSQSGKPFFIDDYHILDQNDDGIAIMDFDGTNRQHVVSGRLPAVLSSDNKYLFSLDNISGGVVLQRSNMTVE